MYIDYSKQSQKFNFMKNAYNCIDVYITWIISIIRESMLYPREESFSISVLKIRMIVLINYNDLRTERFS
jgi:hypothetical protein